MKIKGGLVMKCALIACEMIEKELESALKNWRNPVIWLKRNLHNTPDQLRKSIQEAVDGLDADIDTVLFAFGMCGTAMDSISSATRRLVLPLCDDCISILLSEPRNPRAMYYTDGWFTGRQFLANEYQSFVDKTDEETAQEIYGQILAEYKEFCLMDTGAYDVEVASAIVEGLSKTFQKDWRVAAASTSLLEDLLAGNWDPERFWVLEPRQKFSLYEFLEKTHKA